MKLLKTRRTQILAFFGVLVIVVAVMIASLPDASTPNKASETGEVIEVAGFTDKSAVKVEVAGSALNTTVAVAPTTLMRGVAGLPGLAEDQGMLFVFEEPRELTFWMKDVSFPIDMIWVRGNQVIDVTANVPIAPPNTSDEQLPRYSPKEPADRVLEAAAGWAGRHQVTAGSPVKVNR